uniref:Guanine nucleotide-binding protein-like 1 n=1 Tax=Percolomonas cosmopolitus TaxID=63605 RepID=A0A7S1KMN2_9EUKA
MTRKKPFSASQKKKQLQQKRDKKREKEQNQRLYELRKEQQADNASASSLAATNSAVDDFFGAPDTFSRCNHRKRHDKTVNFLELVSNSSDASQLRSLFRRESNEVIQKRKMWARQPLGDRTKMKPRVLHRFKSVDFPVRPPWHESYQKEKIEQKEETHFVNYVKDLYAAYGERLNHFEHNLEVWRQLWRVLEISDMFLLVADIRHPLFHFPTSLYDYITGTIKKPFILLLNKCDLVPREVQKRWVSYFRENFPKVHICLFTSFNEDSQRDPSKKKSKKARGIRKKPDYTLVGKLWEKCKEINPVSLVSSDTFDDLIAKALSKNENSTKESEHMKREDKVHASDAHVTIGLIGHPNVGKSCVLNALVGKHVVSASYTPGHTKRFQTYFVHEHVKLCDSPGLVFPAIDMPKQLQVLCGIFPIAQEREPFSAVHYLAERVGVEEILKLPFPADATEDGKVDPTLWSGYLICVAYAEKWKLTTKRGRLDEFRAANRILREVLYGNILLHFEPPADVSYEVPEKEFAKMGLSASSDENRQVHEHNGDEMTSDEEDNPPEYSHHSSDDDSDDFPFQQDDKEDEERTTNTFSLLQDSEGNTV